MIIDGHSHACGKFLSAESLLQALDENGVDKVVLVPGELNSSSEYSLPNIASAMPRSNVVKATNLLTRTVMSMTGKVRDIPEGNEHVFRLRSQTNKRVIQFLWATTGIENVVEYLNIKYDAWAFHGVKLHQCWENFSIESDFFAEVAQWAEDMDLPLFIHLHRDGQVQKLIDYKRKHPSLKLIVAHLFGLELFIQSRFMDDNLFFDTSPLQLISDYRMMKAINYVGVERILFGTDTPYGARENLSKSIQRIRQLGIPEDGQEKILGLNIKRLLKL